MPGSVTKRAGVTGCAADGALVRRRFVARSGATRAIALAVFSLLLSSVVVATQARAEEADWGYRMANELMSPYCPGRALPDCPSPQATELRQWIVAQAKAGRSREEVMAQLLDRFGDEMLQRPRASGFGLAAYLLPIVAVVAGGAFLAVFLRRQRTPSVADPPEPAPPLDPELEREIEQEFRRARNGA
ncbi:Cytochrome c-type biogenesis protein CcmH [Myxococcaceae bacterium]|jgi:cytochrome c-type biogenesis protein CcmH|nr:Cytochrome c-type biogenesis protein CcmH [Myxococcaceae bacterium]